LNQQGIIAYDGVVKSLRSGKAKLVIIAGNCPPLRKSELEYYSMVSLFGTMAA
jgi:large subunit ribosomal protein L30e